MRIQDIGQLFPDHALLHRVVVEHPLYPGLGKLIDTLEIAPIGDSIGTCACIKYEKHNRKAILSLACRMPVDIHTEYVLLHEFTHVIDRENPAFGFSESEVNSLTSKQHWRFMDLWNLLIDARLNEIGCFVVQSGPSATMCTINGKLAAAPPGLEGKLLCHISSLASTGLEGAEKLVRDVWANPKTVPTFKELIAIARN